MKTRKPAGWPRYMIAMPLAKGTVGYYWRVRPADRKAGCAIAAEALGVDYGVAKARADLLNAALDDWRAGRRGEVAPRDEGSIRWFFRIIRTETQMWKNLAPRTRIEYARVMRETEIVPVSKPRGAVRTIGDIPVRTIDGGAADKIYAAVRTTRVDTRGETPVIVETVRNRLAEDLVAIMHKGWRVVSRLHPEFFPPIPAGTERANPWSSLELVKRKTATKPAATREQAYTLAYTLRDMGHPHLGAGVLISFEWLQRPENIQAGHLAWSDYRPGESVRILHHKTDTLVRHPLRDADGAQLYPELEAYLADLERLGVPVVLMKGPRSKTARPWKRRRAARVIQLARRKAGLPDDVTWDSCRHGGITELADAGVTENEGMATSGHSTADVFHRYSKKTNTQRLNAALKRRAWIATATPDADAKEEAVETPARRGRRRPPKPRAEQADG
ncbi:MAG: site-specific integrase [Rhodobacteraceae bacterium]|nr:MAG: site-specific integrase [Paracoccaceae bacterium]